MSEEQELQDELGGAAGDPRRCPYHGEIISSPDGLHDAPCGACEAAMDEEPGAEPTPFDWTWWVDFAAQNPPAAPAGDDEILF